MPGFRGRVAMYKCAIPPQPVCWKMHQMQQGYNRKRHGALQLSHRGPSPLVSCWIMLFGRVANRVGESVMANLSGQIDALEQRLKQLKIKQQRMESRRRSIESRRGRRDDLRRKILVGAVVLAKVEEGGFQQATLQEWLDGALTRADDRALFGLRGP